MTTYKSKYKWPDSLKLDPGAIKALEKVPHEQPVLGAWPEDEKFREASDIRAIAVVLLPEFHRELVNAKIAYVLKEKSTTRGPSPAAKSSKLGGVNEFLAGYDFVIVFLWERWKAMDLVTRVALVDHQLERCQVDEGGKFSLLDPDIQEFNNIVSRWGPWQDNIGAFIRAAAQTEMFGEPEPEGKAETPKPTKTSKPALEPVGAVAG